MRPKQEEQEFLYVYRGPCGERISACRKFEFGSAVPRIRHLSKKLRFVYPFLKEIRYFEKGAL
jgi:hypothetical protein